MGNNISVLAKELSLPGMHRPQEGLSQFPTHLPAVEWRCGFADVKSRHVPMESGAGERERERECVCVCVCV